MDYKTEVQFDKKELTLGQIGINKYSTITVEVKEFAAPTAMALEEINVKVQQYMNITGDSDNIVKVSFETNNTISQLIEELAK